MVILLAVVVFLLFGGVSLYAMNLAYRALNELANGLWRGTLLFCRLAHWTGCALLRLSRITWATFERIQIATAQRLYAHWYGFSWRWQRRYIARALRARRAQRRTA
jgi:hypothetical protein